MMTAGRIAPMCSAAGYDKERMRRLATFLAMDARAGVTVQGELEQGGDGEHLPASPSLPASPATHTAGRMNEPRAKDDDV